MAEKVVVTHSYDPDIAALVVDTNCDKLVQSLDPVSIAPKLVSRGLISLQQAEDILDNHTKTRWERNLTFLKLIKSSPDSTWFSSLLEVIGEEKTTETLKEVLEKSYRTVESKRLHRLFHVPQATSISAERSSKSTSSVSSAAKKPLWTVRHPLEVQFLRLKDTLVTLLEETHQPTVKELKEFCSYLVETGKEAQPKIAQELERAKSYAEVMKIVFLQLCRWLHFSFLEMIVDYCSLESMHASLQQYKMKLRPVLQKKFDCTEEALKEAKVTEDMPPDGMRQIVVKYNLDAGGITLEDVASYRQFLSSILEIPHHLLVLISVLYGSLLLELWIPEELTPQVVRRVEEVWRELWRRKVECIEVGYRSFDLLQQSNKEKATLIGASLSVVVEGIEVGDRSSDLLQQSNKEKATLIGESLSVVVVGGWKNVLLSCGTRLYEEYGRHESLQSCVRKHSEAGHPSPEELGALEWLLLHHTPEVAEREGKDPLDVLLTTVYLGCCDVERFVRAVVECLDDTAVESRLVEASMEFGHGSLLTSKSFQPQYELTTWLPDEAVTKLYLKYRHLPSLQDSISPGVENPQHLSHEEAERVKRWFPRPMMGFVVERESSLRNFILTLVEAGVTDEELRPVLDRMGDQGTEEAMDYERMTVDVAEARLLSKMKKSFPHSQEDVRAIQVSFQMYSASISISPDDLLQAANSQRRDIYQVFFETLERQKVDLEPHKSYLRGKVPLYYQQDLEQAFTPAGAVAMETSTMTTALSAVPPVAGAPRHSTALSKVKRQFSLLVSDILPSVSKEMAPLANHFAGPPVGSAGATLFSAEEAMTVARNLPRYWSWYECAFLKEVTSYCHSNEDAMSALLEMYDGLRHTPLPECFPQGPRMANQLAPPPGYTPLRLTLPSAPEDVPMGRLWSLKKHLCSSLALQPYALLLKGYMEGSTHIIFHISQHVTLDEDRVAAMFVGAKQAGLYPHSITTALGTAQEVEHRLMDMLPLIKRRRVRGQMEGLTVAEREREHQACFKA